jgi:hypothetical protein
MIFQTFITPNNVIYAICLKWRDGISLIITESNGGAVNRIYMEEGFLVKEEIEKMPSFETNSLLSSEIINEAKKFLKNTQ